MTAPWDDPGLKPPSPLPDIRGLGHDAQVDAIVGWFFDNFEDPVEQMPWDEGEFVFIWGGPYDADEEVSEAFADVADRTAIAAAVARIADDGWQWAPNSSRIKDEPEDEPDSDGSDDEEEWRGGIRE